MVLRFAVRRYSAERLGNASLNNLFDGKPQATVSRRLFIGHPQAAVSRRWMNGKPQATVFGAEGKRRAVTCVAAFDDFRKAGAYGLPLNDWRKQAPAACR